MGNSLIIGHVTKIWKLEWTEADDTEELDDDGVAERRNNRREWCETMSRIDNDVGKVYHWIMIRHFESGKVIVFVDGAQMGTGLASFNSCELKYRVGNRIGITKIVFNEQFNFSYEFITSILSQSGDTEVLKEINETLVGNHNASVVTATVTKGSLENSGDGAVAMYHIVCKLQNDSILETDKRFSDFVTLDRDIKSAFQGSHMISSMPTLPPKNIQVFSNHSQPAFIAKRKAGLDIYMRKILSLPRVVNNPYVMQFLGIIPAFASSDAPPLVNV